MPVRPGAARLSLSFARCVLLVALLLPAAARSRAQTAVDGAIAGRVVAAEGGPVAGAEITATGEDGVEHTAVSGRQGDYAIVRLAPGVYTLDAHAEGYRGQVDLQVTVELGRTTEVQLGRVGINKLAMPLPWPVDRRGRMIDPFRQQAAQEAGVLRRDPESAVVGAHELDGLPVTGGDLGAVAQQAAGAQPDPEADSQTLVSVRGMAAIQNSSAIDGISHDQSFGGVPVGAGSESTQAEDGEVPAGGVSGQGMGQWRHAGAAYTFSRAAVRELRLSQQGYSALYGQAAGGVLTAVSRGGGSALHGSAFLSLRDSAWAAANPFSIATSYQDGVVSSRVVKPNDQQRRFGGTLGGPAIPGRLFYFGAYDEQRRDFPAIGSPYSAQFYALTATQTALLGTRGVSHAQTNAALNYLSGLMGEVPRRRDQRIAFGRLDGRVRASQRVGISFNQARWSSPAGATTAAVVARARASLGNNNGQVQQGVAWWTAFFGRHLSNEVRVGYGRDLEMQTAQTPLPQEPAIAPGGYAPEVSIGPEGMMFGTPASVGRSAYPDERRVQVTDMLTWQMGKHLLRVGGEVSRVHDRVEALNNREGTFYYDSGTTGGHAGGLVDWITDYTFGVQAYPNGGCPSIHAAVHYSCFTSYSQSFGQQQTVFDMGEMAGYAQDDWRVAGGLKVSLGVRYELETLPAAQAPNMALDAVFGTTGATSVLPRDGNNYGPRVGVAWQPFRSGWVFRAGYGLYFGRLAGATVRSALMDTALPASTTHVRITPTTITPCPQVTSQGFGYPCAYVAQPPAAVATTTSAMVFDKRFQLPAIQQGSVTAEHELGAGVVASATYMMNMDRQLPGSRDINIAPATAQQFFQLSGGAGMPGLKDGERFVVPVYTARVSSSFGPVTDIVSHGNGTYNALTLQARKRSRGGLDLRLSWTWSKALDYGTTMGATPRTNGQFDPFQIGYDKGPSSLNYPHRVVVSAVWQPRVPSESRWIRGALDRWEFAPVFIESSGRPYTYQIYGGRELSGGRESINGSGGATYLPTVGRNTLRLPDTMRVDLRVSRTVRVTERVRVRGTAEVFNLANRVNYTGVQQRAFLVGTAVNGVTPLVFQDAATVASEGLNVQPFGAYTAAGTSASRERQMQVGLRLEF